MPTDHVHLLNSVGNKQISTKSFTMFAIRRILRQVIVCTETTNKLIKNVMIQNLKSTLIYMYSTTKNRKALVTG